MTNTQNPASEHYSVLLQESIEHLNINPNGIYIDCTFGRGGHSKQILKHLNSSGHLLAFDRDIQAYDYGINLSKEYSNLTMIHGNFSELSIHLDNLGISSIDGILADFGVSSPQLDQSERGFSFRFNAPLDMRMDQTQGQTVAEYLLTCDEKDLADIIFKYGEERFSRKIARAIYNANPRPQTTKQLADLISTQIKAEKNQHPATRTFQALRIFINQELRHIEKFLPQAIEKLNPKGRLAVISFHSLEDRIAKQYFNDLANPQSNLPKNLPLRQDQLPQGTIKLIGKAIKPSTKEIDENNRSRSAVLRVIEKI